MNKVATKLKTGTKPGAMKASLLGAGAAVTLGALGIVAGEAIWDFIKEEGDDILEKHKATLGADAKHPIYQRHQRWRVYN